MMTGYNNHQTELDLNNLHKEITEKLQVCKIILLIEEVRAIFCCSECFYYETCCPHAHVYFSHSNL